MCNVGLDLLGLFGSIMDSPDATADSADSNDDGGKGDTQTSEGGADADAETHVKAGADPKPDADADADAETTPPASNAAAGNVKTETMPPASNAAAGNVKTMASVSSLQASHQPHLLVDRENERGCCHRSIVMYLCICLLLLSFFYGRMFLSEMNWSFVLSPGIFVSQSAKGLGFHRCQLPLQGRVACICGWLLGSVLLWVSSYL